MSGGVQCSVPRELNQVLYYPYLSVLPEDNDFLLPLKQSPKLQSKMADIKQKAKQSDMPHHRIVELMRKARVRTASTASEPSIKKKGHRRSKSDSAFLPNTAALKPVKSVGEEMENMDREEVDEVTVDQIEDLEEEGDKNCW